MHNKFVQKQLNLFRQNIFFCWALHLLTSFGIICSFFALKNITDGEIFKAFMWLGLGLFIDGIDGTIARFLKVSVKLPHIDGHMLDSIIDYINYIFIPAFMLIISNITRNYEYSTSINNNGNICHFIFE